MGSGRKKKWGNDMILVNEGGHFVDDGLFQLYNGFWHG